MNKKFLKPIKKRIALLSSDKKSVLSLVGATTIAQGLNFLFAPIQTRLFSPEVFGELAVFTSITGIVGVIVCLRYELAIVLPKDDDEGFSLLKLSWFFAGMVSLAALVVFGLWGKQIYAWFKAPNLARFWYYVPITLLFTGVIQAANYWLTRKRQFKVLSYNKVLPVLAANAVSIGLGFLGDRALGARLFAVLASNIVNIAVLASVLIPDSKIKREKSFKKTELIGKYKNFLVYDIWGALINNLSWMIVPILMNTYYGSFAAGQYSIGMRIIQLPASLIGASICQVFLKNASEKKHSAKLYLYSVSIIKKLLLYTSPLLLIIALFGKFIFRFAFGNQWEVAGTYSQILAPWALLWFIASPMHSLFTIVQKQNLYLVFSITNLFTRFFSLAAGKYLFRNNDIMGIILFSFSGFIVYGISLIMAFSIAKKSDKIIQDQ